MKNTVAALLLLGTAVSALAQPTNVLKVTASWNLPSTEERIRQAVGEAKGLGFNAYAWCSFHKSAILADECKKQGMFSIRVIEPLRKRKEARLQVIEKGEEAWLGFLPVGTNTAYQYGGEPVPGHPEMSDHDLACPRDEGVVEIGRASCRERVCLYV